MKKLQRYRKQLETQMQRDEKMKTLKARSGGIRFGGKKAAAAAADDEDSAADLDTQENGVELGQVKMTGPPRPKEGWMEKKNAREKYGGGWQNRYFVIRPPGIVYYYKKADTTGPPLGSLDLGRAVNVALHRGKDGELDATRIDVEMPDGTMKVRCRSEEYAEEWR